MFERMLTPEFWEPVFTSTVVIGALGWAISPWYRGRVEKGIQHRFDQQIEELRSSFRREEERLRAQLQSQQDQIAALRTGPLAQLSARRSALDARKLQAIERLWEAVVALGPARAAMTFTSVLKMDELLARSEGTSSSAKDYQEIGNVLWQTTGLEKLTSAPKALSERPFVNPLTWALFSAYQAATSVPTMQIAALRAGAGPKVFNEQSVVGILKEALPEHTNFIEQFGLRGVLQVTGELEKKLLDQLRKDIEGQEDDAIAVARATEILKNVEAAVASMRGVPSVPADMIAEKIDVRP